MVTRGNVKNKIMGATLSAAIALTAIPVCGMTSLACDDGYKLGASYGRGRHATVATRGYGRTNRRQRLPFNPMRRRPTPVPAFEEIEPEEQAQQVDTLDLAYLCEYYIEVANLYYGAEGTLPSDVEAQCISILNSTSLTLRNPDATTTDYVAAKAELDSVVDSVNYYSNIDTTDEGTAVVVCEAAEKTALDQLFDLCDEVEAFIDMFGGEVPMEQMFALQRMLATAEGVAVYGDELRDSTINEVIAELTLAYDEAIDAADAAAAAPAEEIAPDYGMNLDEQTEDNTVTVIYGEQPEDMDLTGVDLIIQDRCPTLPEERPVVIYGEQPEDMDLTDVDLIIQDRCPTLPEERPVVIYGEQPEDMDLTGVDLIIQDRCPTLPEERTPVIYGEQPEDMDLSNVDLIVPDRYNTNPEDTAEIAESQDEQTSDFEITTGDSFTIEAQPEVTEEPEVAAEPETQTPAAETPAPETQATETQTPASETQTVVIIINNTESAAPAAVETTPAPVAQTVVETAAPAAAPAASVSAPAASAAPAGQVLGASRDEASTLEDLVERLYVNALNRNSDLAGKTFWINKILNDDVELGDVVRGFLNSAEFNARNLNDDDFITLLYKVMFNRTPSSKEKSYWMAALANGASRNEIISAFLNSAEFEATYDAYEI